VRAFGAEVAVKPSCEQILKDYETKLQKSKELQQKLERLNNELLTVLEDSKQDIKKLRNKINSLKEELRSLKADLDQLKRDWGVLTTQLQQSTEELKNVQELQNQAAELLTNLESSFNDYKAKTEEIIKALQGEIVKIRRQRNIAIVVAVGEFFLLIIK